MEINSVSQIVKIIQLDLQGITTSHIVRISDHFILSLGPL